MEEIRYHNYPDVTVSKTVLLEYFPMSIATLNRRLKVMRTVKQFRDVEVTTAGKLLINVRGFYLFLKYLENHRNLMV